MSTAALGAQWTDHIPHDVDSWLSEGPHGQQALFPHTGKGPTRPLEHAEMTPDQFRTLPGAWHHGTYHHEMPTNANKLGSATSGGIHFGTHQAAVERIHGLGYRNESYRDAAARPGARIKPLNDAAPAEIHVRRIALGTQFANTPDTPGHDADDSWSHPENQPHANLYYRNAHEDKGALSIKVADDSAVTSHTQAVQHAVSTGGRVHPLSAALLSSGKGLDVPEKYVKPEPEDPRVTTLLKTVKHDPDALIQYRDVEGSWS